MKPLLALFALTLVPVSSAAILYDNGGPTTPSSGRIADYNFLVNFGLDFGMIIDDFTLDGDATLQGINWWGSYAFANTPEGDDQFTMQIFADAGGAPGTALTDAMMISPTRTLTAFIVNNSPILNVYQYWVVLPDIELTAGTYWLGIVNDTVGDLDDDWGWVSTLTPDGGSNAVRGGEILGEEFAFSVEGIDTQAEVTPEPSTILLSALGLGGIILAGRRRA